MRWEALRACMHVCVYVCVYTLRMAGGSGVEVKKPGLGAKIIQGRGLTQGRQGWTGE